MVICIACILYAELNINVYVVLLLAMVLHSH